MIEFIVGLIGLALMLLFLYIFIRLTYPFFVGLIRSLRNRRWYDWNDYEYYYFYAIPRRRRRENYRDNFEPRSRPKVILEEEE